MPSLEKAELDRSLKWRRVVGIIALRLLAALLWVEVVSYAGCRAGGIG